MFNDNTIIDSELFKCEICDEHLRKRLYELKETFFRIFKNVNKIIKYIRAKDESTIKKTIDDLAETEKEFIHQMQLFKKLIQIKKANTIIKTDDAEQKRELVDCLNTKRDKLRVYFYYLEI
jgi:hypothetical protein